MKEAYRTALRSGRALNVAHRGASAYAPENTFAAFELALAQGADVLELDVHLSRDGDVVVIHDDRVDRTTDGVGAVSEMATAELQALDAGAWFDERFRGERIPTLTEVLARFADRAFLDIEFKAGIEVDMGAILSAAAAVALGESVDHAAWRRPPGAFIREDMRRSIPLAERTMETLRDHGATDRVILSCFAAGVLAWARGTHPDVATQWSVAGFDLTEDCGYAARLGFDMLGPQHYAVTEDGIAQAHAHDLIVHIYTPEGADEMGRLLDLGADAVKSDRPDVLRAVLQSRRGPRGGR